MEVDLGSQELPNTAVRVQAVERACDREEKPLALQREAEDARSSDDPVLLQNALLQKRQTGLGSLILVHGEVAPGQKGVGAHERRVATHPLKACCPSCGDGSGVKAGMQRYQGVYQEKSDKAILEQGERGWRRSTEAGGAS